MLGSTRLAILYALLEAGELCVCDLARVAGVAENVVSQAMRLLRAADVVRTRRDGRRIHYRLADAHVRMLLDLSADHVRHHVTVSDSTGPVSGSGVQGFQALRSWRMTMSLLMSVAVIGAIAIGQWPEAAVVIWLFGVAELIEALSLERARNAIRSLVGLAPEMASVRSGDGWVTVPTGDVPLGGVILIKPGERIALDGRVSSAAQPVAASSSRAVCTWRTPARSEPLRSTRRAP